MPNVIVWRRGRKAVSLQVRIMSWIVRPVLLFAAFNFAWEVLQLPFYTLLRTGTAGEIIFAVFHCTAGDVLIGAAAWAASRFLADSLAPHRRTTWPVLACFFLLALGYAVFSEWLNVHVRGNWAYTALMPLVPPLGTGLTPLLQWIIVPLLTWTTAGDHVRSKLAGRPADD